MIAYRIIAGCKGDGAEDAWTYLREGQAITRLLHIQQHSRIDKGDYYDVQFPDIAKLSNQKVQVHGAIIGFQFARTKYGKRTMRRTVRNIHRNDKIGGIVGTVTVWGNEYIATFGSGRAKDEWALLMPAKTS